MGFRAIRFGKLSTEEREQVFANSQASLYLPEGFQGRKYLLEDRGLDVETVANFRLGYVPLNIDHAFSGRIVMPIFDLCGNLLALSVRPATTDERIDDEFGKYWNESYDKGRHLYGLNLAKFWIVRFGFAIIVEGQMDTMAMHSWGMANTVGVLGGAFTPFQAMQLKRWTKNFVLLFDGDKAGKKHVERCEEVLSYYEWRLPAHSSEWSLPTGFKNRISSVPQCGLSHVNASIPNGTDPSKFLKEHGGGAMRKMVLTAMNDNLMKVSDEWATWA